MTISASKLTLLDLGNFFTATEMSQVPGTYREVDRGGWQGRMGS